MEAMMSPISAMKRRFPILVRSFLVVVPISAMTPNVPAVTANVIAIDPIEYARKMNDRVMPFRTAYAMNSAVAVEACILLIPAEIQNTMPSSARIRMMKMPLFWNTILLSSADVPTAHAVMPLTSSAKVIHQ